jgi:ribonuclease I
MKSYIPRGLASISCMLMLAMLGCNNTAQPPVAPHSNTEARRSTPEYQPQDNSSYAGGDEHRRRPRRGRPEEQAPPGQFDFYLLNLSWSPEFCATHGESPECGHNLGFVVHGLWPQDSNGNYPQHAVMRRDQPIPRPTQISCRRRAW